MQPSRPSSLMVNMPRANKESLPPSDPQAEEAVIAALLMDEGSYVHVSGIVKAEDFYRESHAWLYEACVNLAERGESITIPTVARELGDRLDQIGGEPFIVELVGRHFAATGVEAHAKIVARDALYRRLINAGSQIVRVANEGGDDADKALTFAEGLLGGLRNQVSADLNTMGTSELEDTTGLMWNLPALDRCTMGIVPGRLTIAAGSSGQGKSFLAAQIARSVATQDGHVVIFSLEMSAQEYESRMVHALAGVRKRSSYLEPPLTEEELAVLDVSQQEIAHYQIHIMDKALISIGEVTSTVRALNAERHVDLVVIDYLQLMRLADTDNNAQALKAVTAALKVLAADVKCHVILLSQMNRASLGELRQRGGMNLECVAEPEKKFPQPFKEALMGGAVENDADLVVMLQRHPDCDNHVELCVVKNRNGREQHGLLINDFSMGRFRTLTQDEATWYAKGGMDHYRNILKDQGMVL